MVASERVDPHRQVLRGRRERAAPKGFRILRDRDGVQVDDAEVGVELVLQAHPLLHRAQRVAEVQGVRRGLHAGEDDALGWLAHDGFDLSIRVIPIRVGSDRSSTPRNIRRSSAVSSPSQRSSPRWISSWTASLTRRPASVIASSRTLRSSGSGRAFDVAVVLEVVEGADDPGLVGADGGGQRGLRAHRRPVQGQQDDVAPHRQAVRLEHRLLRGDHLTQQRSQHRGQIGTPGSDDFAATAS